MTLDNFPKSKQTIAKNLLAELKFIASALKDLKEIIKAEGYEMTITNGTQSFIKERPAFASYIKLVGKYSALYHQLERLMNSEIPSDELTEFLEQP